GCRRLATRHGSTQRPADDLLDLHGPLPGGRGIEHGHPPVPRLYPQPPAKRTFHVLTTWGNNLLDTDDHWAYRLATSSKRARSCKEAICSCFGCSGRASTSSRSQTAPPPSSGVS